MMVRKHILLSLLLSAVCGATQAQDALLRMADEKFNDLSYVQAIRLYWEAFLKAEPDIEHLRRMAECHWNLRDTKGAAEWYGNVCTSSEAEALDVYRYAEALRANGKHAESDQVLERFVKLMPQDSRGTRKANSQARLAAMLEQNGLADRVEPGSFNSERADMSPYIHGNVLLFASARAPEYTTRRHHTWDDQPFLDLYVANVDNKGGVSDLELLRGRVNSDYHESNAVISRDGTELYFTRNNFHAGQRTLSSNGINNLQIFVRQRARKGWAHERPFTYNDREYSVGHPALSPEGTTLYFTSDKPGGLGGKDIYKCERTKSGPWSTPVNLGPTVNTEGDEMFPYVAADGKLYFASDGHLGLGGTDLFRVAMGPNGLSEPQNLGAPINSSRDDFGLCFDATGQRGYFCSDRSGGAGGDDIYTFTVGLGENAMAGPEHRKEFRVWRGRVVDVKDGLPVAHVPVRLLNRDHQELARTVTAENGTFEFPTPGVPGIVEVGFEEGGTVELPIDDSPLLGLANLELPDIQIQSTKDLPVHTCIRDGMTNEPLEGVKVTVTDKSTGELLFSGITDINGKANGVIPDRRFGENADLEVVFAREGYISRTIDADFRVLAFLERTLSGSENETLSPVMLGVDIGKAMNLPPIYFDYGSDGLRGDAASVLDLVAEVMREIPSIRIDLRSHTDSRASTAYNDDLSDRRAKATRSYLIGEGVGAERITAQGFGERKLVNHCDDGVECSEAEHTMNRRTEFIITSVDGVTLGQIKR